MIPSNQYDFIIAGAGCAGLSMAMRLIASGKFGEKKILLVDQDAKNKDDRTWCFWEKEAGFFEPIVRHHWNKAWVHDTGFSRLMDIEPYTYKLIRGADFYAHCLAEIGQQTNFTRIQAKVSKIGNDDTGSFIILNEEKLYAKYIFNSILFDKPVLKDNEHYLLQHFKGWMIETEQPAFNPGEAVLMDFRVPQNHGTTFIYVMPFSPTRALVEYTLFTENLLPQESYELGLKNYIDTFLKPGNYKIVHEEFGVIPMTNYEFDKGTGGIINIGTAGGQTKASSGYTFQFIQKTTENLVKRMEKGLAPQLPPTPGRFHFYDSVLLHILAKDMVPGHEVFSRIFKKTKPQQVLRFLDNESSFADELKIISSLPTWPFLKAAIKQW